MAKKTSFADQFSELEEITEWFETADVDLDEGLKKFERGLELAKVLKQQVRDSDICCRFGGEEFVVVLPFTSSAVEVGTIAERIRVKAMELGVGDLPITISLGVAICDHSVSSPHELIEHADRALYRAKRAGKNRVAFSTVPTVL